MDRATQSGRQGSRTWGTDRVLLSANQESVAQPDRAEMAAREALDRRTGPPADGGRDRGTRLCVFRLCS